MLGEQIGQERGQITGMRVLPGDGSAVQVEFSFQASGTLLGIPVGRLVTVNPRACRLPSGPTTFTALLTVPWKPYRSDSALSSASAALTAPCAQASAPTKTKITTSHTRHMIRLAVR